MIVDGKERRYNLYYILSEKIDNEKVSSKIYYDMLCFIMENNQNKEKEDEDEKRRFNKNCKSCPK